MAAIRLLNLKWKPEALFKKPGKAGNRRPTYTGTGQSGQGAATNLRQAGIDESGK
jgi:hypothetical protein